MKIKTRDLMPWAAILFTLAATVLLLRYYEGRLWICDCGRVLIWMGEAWSGDTSQHLFDPYSFTHVLHGFIFFWLIAKFLPRLSKNWQIWLVVALESGWEVLENSEFVVRRYREATGVLGYFGDTVVNSAGDIIACTLGFILARRLGFRRSLAVFFAVEAALLIWIRDSLLLNVVQLIYPLEFIIKWQAGGH